MKFNWIGKLFILVTIVLFLPNTLLSQVSGTKETKPDPDDPNSILGKSPPSAYNWANKKSKEDKDADGIPDKMEAVPLNFGGLIVSLDPQKKDVIILVDYVGNDTANMPTTESLAIVFASFGSAPVKGLKKDKGGVALHLIRNNVGFPVPSNTPVGTFVNNEYDWSDLDYVKQYTINTNNLGSVPRIYHYCLSCDNYAGSPSSGLSRNDTSTYAKFRTGGVDFICSLQGAQSQTKYAGMTGGTIMHEFGHNLGLTHGGYDHVNYKPNYISIMNYHFQFNGITVNGQQVYDYSRVLLKPIDERNIKETAGLGPKATGLWTLFKYPINGQTVTFPIVGDLKKNIDWNQNGVIDIKGYGLNLNYPYDEDGTWLVSELNWQNINFTGRGNIGQTNKANMPDLLSIMPVEKNGNITMPSRNISTPNYEGRFTKVPEHLICRKLTEADKEAIRLSNKNYTVEEILGPGVSLKTTSYGNLTLFELVN